jgi:plastocyanin
MIRSAFSAAVRSVFILNVLARTSFADPVAPGLAIGSAGPVSNVGAIEGIVRYRADAQRPWLRSRYYVQNAAGDALAETIVALDGPGLSAAAPPYTPRTFAMDQVNFQFVPETLAIRAGDSVRITNSDEALHNVMTPDGRAPFNLNIARTQEVTRVFERAGGLNEPIRLSCVFHGAMRAWIYVFDHPWFQLTGRDGRFHLDQIPTGAYALGLIHPSGKLQASRTIEVTSNHTTHVEITLSPDNLIGLRK